MSDKFEIEQRPYTPPRRNAGKQIYPWEKLNPGDAFFVPGRTVNQISSAVSACKPRRLWGWAFACRTGEKDGVKGVWVHRIESDPAKPRPDWWPYTADEAAKHIARYARLQKGLPDNDTTDTTDTPVTEEPDTKI